ncbi:MAG TPA: ATP-binding cassette domain-containing protein [Acidimicrobiales bacterium]|nr:ATP-binding cassette domain-containing protein [Acidimicrobiales bacterium]
MGHIEVNGVSYALDDGTPLMRRISFRVDEGSVTALVGPNGSGKTTLLRMLAGDVEPDEGSVSVGGRLAVMRQFIGSIRDDTTVESLLTQLCPPSLRRAGESLAAAEARVRRSPDEKSQFTYAQALADWGDLGGYAEEVAWDTCTTAAIGLAFSEARSRQVASLSGGEQKRVVLHYVFASEADVLILDEPDNYLDVPGKEWLEEMLRATRKTVLIVSHDRELLRRAATRIVTLEPGPFGCGAWVHGAGMATYHQAREDRLERLDELRRRWDEDLARLKAIVAEYRRKAAYNSDFSSKLRSAEHRLARFVESGPPEEVPRAQRISMRLRGGRTGKRALVCRSLSLDGLTDAFDLEVVYGERVGVLGPNGTGKSHFLRLLAGDAVGHSGEAVLGARVVPGHFAQTHEHAEFADGTIADLLARAFDLSAEQAIAALGRYELSRSRRQSFDTLSGGQQARLQILMLELSGATMLLLDEPTDNLDVESAEALEAGLSSFEGTVLAVTHDRFFAASLDRFVVFSDDGRVVESPTPVWSER